MCDVNVPLRRANVALCHCWPLLRPPPVVLQRRQPLQRHVVVAHVRLLLRATNAHDVPRRRNESARVDADVADGWRRVALIVACHVRR